jgi:hypothetical protein
MMVMEGYEEKGRAEGEYARWGEEGVGHKESGGERQPDVVPMH